MGQAGKRSPQNLLVRLPVHMLNAYRHEGHWSDQTIHDCAMAQRDRDPSRIAVRDRDIALTYEELTRLAASIASDLACAGLRSGDRVAAWMSSRAEMAAILLACSRNGYVFCPSLHRNHTAEEIEALLVRMRACAFFAEEGYGAGGVGADIFERSGKLHGLKKIYRLPPLGPRSLDMISSFLRLGAEHSEHPVSCADDVVYLAFTSGTTGEPKGVMHSNNTLLANARAISADWRFGPHSVIYTLSPLSHNLGFGALVLTMFIGGEIVLHDLPRGASLLDRLQEVEATFIFGVPAHAIDLLAEMDLAKEVHLPRLKGFRISGAAVPPVVVERLMAHGIVPQSGYGMTEAGSHNYTLPDDDASLIVSTSGRACHGYEIGIFAADDADRPLGVGETGHIGGRGASLMLGYFGNQQATETSFNATGWFMTGDLGRLDENGYLQITGRIKEVIIRGGHNIHPTKIEVLALRHPHVERAAAIPVKDERLGEKVCIVVMGRNGDSIDPQTLLSHLHSEGLSKYDMPEYFLQVDDIPLSASGKILKRALMPKLEAGTLRPEPVRWSS